MGTSIKSVYQIWKYEQHILTSKYDVLHSLVPSVKYFNVTRVKYSAKPLKFPVKVVMDTLNVMVY